ncbi:MAG: 4Fe-4S binding protein, partial [Wenzhouxiangellaceae bacterium]|nr:4Fe-4S binding protein [Wenzhouxiangellaceae bacterium]
EFQKPRFFAYDPDLCAHGARGLGGCRQCIDACATDAAFSIGEKIEVDPYLCQGCGSCATVCPTGAIRYAAPEAGDLLDSLRRLCAAYRSACRNSAGEQTAGDMAHSPAAPAIVLFSADGASDIIESAAPKLPGHWLPVAVEDAGSVGLETWFSLLAFGAGQIMLLTGPDPASGLVKASQGQIEVAGAILEALGDRHCKSRILLWPGQLELPKQALEIPPIGDVPGTFGALGNKRETARLALAHLHEQAVAAADMEIVDIASLPDQAMFGSIDVDRDACTLCMACVSVCPASAIQAGGEHPRLNFREDHCVQCGLCATACPETAITLQARMNFDAQLAPSERVLNEQEMQHCNDCGKAFATRQMINRMLEKLSGHWMYQNEQARQRLRLCEDCRIKQMWDDNGAIEVHPGER